MKATAKARKHDAVCGRANLTAIDEMVGGIMRRFDSMRVNGASDDDWERLREDARDLSYALTTSEFSMYERGVFEVAETLRSVRYLERRHVECDLLDPMRDSYRWQQFAKHAQLGAQVDVMAAVFDVRKSAIDEDVTTICGAKELQRKVFEKLGEHKRRVE